MTGLMPLACRRLTTVPVQLSHQNGTEEEARVLLVVPAEDVPSR